MVRSGLLRDFVHVCTGKAFVRVAVTGEAAVFACCECEQNKQINPEKQYEPKLDELTLTRREHIAWYGSLGIHAIGAGGHTRVIQQIIAAGARGTHVWVVVEVAIKATRCTR